MKKLILLGLSLASTPILVHATDATIKLADAFLQHDGVYKFTLDIKGKLKDKAWIVIVSGGNATIKDIDEGKDKSENTNEYGTNINSAKGIEENTEQIIKKNITYNKTSKEISVKIGILKSKEAKDLEVQALEGDLAPQLATMGLRKDSKEFTVDVGPGLILGYIDAKKVLHPHYELSMGNVPSGSFTLKLVRPVAKDKTFHFKFINGQLVDLSGDDEGKIINDILHIDARVMCASRRIKKTAAITGTSTVALGLLASGIASGYAAPAITWGVAAGATAAGIGAKFGGSAVGAVFGFREATVQVTCEQGSLAGKAVKIDYEECKNNKWELGSSAKKILISGK